MDKSDDQEPRSGTTFFIGTAVGIFCLFLILGGCESKRDLNGGTRDSSGENLSGSVSEWRTNSSSIAQQSQSAVQGTPDVGSSDLEQRSRLATIATIQRVCGSDGKNCGRTFEAAARGKPRAQYVVGEFNLAYHREDDGTFTPDLLPNSCTHAYKPGDTLDYSTCTVRFSTPDERQMVAARDAQLEKIS